MTTIRREMSKMRKVIVESPFAGDGKPATIAANVAYAKRALRDALARGEAPLASHLLFTQPGILRDEIAEERSLGIDAGHAWISVADAMVVYKDRGISLGMRQGIQIALKLGILVEYREIVDL